MANIVITGGSRGIGAAMVRLLARDGHRICFLYRESIETARSLSRLLQAEGCDVTAVQCDISRPGQVRTIFDNMREKWGPADVLINNAGISWSGVLQDMLDSEWQALFETNVYGMFYCTKAVLPGMIARRKGVIINISSIWGSHPASCEVGYSATKGAIDAFTRSLADEVAYSGIRVNAIAPGVVHTDMVDRLGAETNAVLHDEMPMGRYCNPEEVAQLARYLISDEASYMTGQIITLAGGFII